MAVDRFAGEHLELLVEFTEPDRKIKLGVDACGQPLARIHGMDATRRAEPACLAIERSDAFAKGRMRNREALLRPLGIDFDRILLSTCVNSSLLDARSDLVESVGAAGCGQIFVQNLLRGWQAFLRGDF